MPDRLHRLAAHNIEGIGAGPRGKCSTVSASGVPCVMTLIAAEGMELPTALRKAAEENAETLAALIVGLHEDTRNGRQAG